ncbi:MAG: hypothetical protein KDC38_04220 [Planctomycetes bacterium]|nr:hypothetical protein [Planctomycetota bacterium]
MSIACRQCSRRVEASTTRCPHCGIDLGNRSTVVECPRCHSANRCDVTARARDRHLRRGVYVGTLAGAALGGVLSSPQGTPFGIVVLIVSIAAVSSALGFILSAVGWTMHERRHERLRQEDSLA